MEYGTFPPVSDAGNSFCQFIEYGAGFRRCIKFQGGSARKHQHHDGRHQILRQQNRGENRDACQKVRAEFHLEELFR